MATLSITGIGYTGLYWQITGLGNPFNQSYYQEAGICANSFTNGTYSEPDIISSDGAPVTGSAYQTDKIEAVGSWTPGRSYYTYGYTVDTYGRYWNAGSKSYTMKIGAPASLSVDNVYTNALYITWTAPSGGDGVVTYDLRYRTSGGSYSYVYDISGSRDYYTVSGLNTGTTYYISLMANGEDASSSWSSECSGTTIAPTLATPTLNTSATTKTATTITVTINAVTGASTYYAYLYNSSGSTLLQSPAGQSSRTFTFSGLSINTTYNIKVKCAGTGYADSAWSGFYGATTGLYTWEWVTSKTSGANFNVTASEWLSFMNKINEVRNAKGLPNWGFGKSEVVSGNDFKYYLFTQCANAIADINNNAGGVNSACQNVGQGDTIYASYFTNLRAALNNIINSL